MPQTCGSAGSENSLRGGKFGQKNAVDPFSGEWRESDEGRKMWVGHQPCLASLGGTPLAR